MKFVPRLVPSQSKQSRRCLYIARAIMIQFQCRDVRSEKETIVGCWVLGVSNVNIKLMSICIWPQELIWSKNGGSKK